VALAGCGSSSTGSSSTGSSSTGSSSTGSSSTSSTSGAASGGGEAGKSADQILADARAALGGVHSFQFNGTTTTAAGTNSVTGAVQLPGSIEVSQTRGAGVLRVLFTRGQGYFWANGPYWAAQSTNQALAARVANQWIVATGAVSEAVAPFAAYTDPATIGICLLGRSHGTLVNAGTATVSGQPAAVIADQGDKPGSAPGKLYVANTGTPLPLRAVQTGPRQPGGNPDPRCHASSGSRTVATEATFSGYGQPVTITAPARARTLAQLGLR
jgi:hypothetical protein